MLDGHEGFWRAIVVLMLAALAGVAYLAYQLRPRTPVATELARTYKPQPPAAQEQAIAAPAPEGKQAAPAAPAQKPAVSAPTSLEPAQTKASTSASGVAGTPLRRFLPMLGSGFDEAQLNHQLGVVLAALARHDEAVRAYGVVLERAPQSSPSWIGLGVSYEALGKRPEALDAYRRALSVASIGAEDRQFAERRVRALQ